MSRCHLSTFSFVWQTQNIFAFDPSIYCVSVGNPLYPAIIPEATDMDNENIMMFQNNFQKERKQKANDFDFLTSDQILRRVDHFMFHGATLITRSLIDEILADFTLSPYPVTRAHPRPKDYLPQGMKYPKIKDYDFGDLEDEPRFKDRKEPKVEEGEDGLKYRWMEIEDEESSGEFDVMVIISQLVTVLNLFSIMGKSSLSERNQFKCYFD